MSETVRQLDGALSIRGDRLWVEECDVTNLAMQFGTPLYVMSASQLLANCATFTKAFESTWHLGPVALYPSIKANYTLAVRKLLVEAGTGCDVFGENELAAAVRAATPGHKISVNGSTKSARLMDSAVRLGASIVIDSEREFLLALASAEKFGARANLLLRLRPDCLSIDHKSDLIPGRTIGDALDSYKPGLDPAVAGELIVRASRSAYVSITGLMVHFGRHSSRPDVWSQFGAAFAEAINNVCRGAGPWLPKVVDIGGGFPAPRDPTNPLRIQAPAIAVLAREIIDPIARMLTSLGCRQAELRIEPGRGLFADAGVHLSSVVHVKTQTRPTQRTWIEVDTSEAFLPDIALERASFATVFASAASRPLTGSVHIVGASCGFDVLGADVQAPTLRVGDAIAFLDTGAYQDAGASNFNAMSRPATVLVRGADALLVKRRETTEDVFCRDIAV
jgi:diaminopimelate decarboxylase